MRTDDFDEWLKRHKLMKENARRSRVSNCRRVERCEEVDLDDQYKKDEIKSLRGRFRYSKDEGRRNVRPRHKVPIKGDVYNGTATLLSAMNLYFEFCAFDETDYSGPTGLKGASSRVHSKGSERRDWPEWSTPGDEDLLVLARIVAKYSRFLHPKIVQGLVDDNMNRRQEWSDRLRERGIDPDLYLWDRCACAFPGVRRHSGHKEISRFRIGEVVDAAPIPHALKLDDNTFPKQLWSFIFTGRKFQKRGPKGFSLAHLADHKKYKKRGGVELLTSSGATRDHWPGLYTSATNTIYIADSLIRPSDFAVPLRNLLQLQADRLYGAVCNLLPEGYTTREPASELWAVQKFDWADPVGETRYLKDFLEFRLNKMEALFGAVPPNQ